MQQLHQHDVLNRDKNLRYSGTFRSLRYIFQKEGIPGLWRGNAVNAARVFPYSAAQFASYDFFKAELEQRTTSLTLRKVGIGALAGTVATVVTHPLDNLGLRMTVSPRKLATRETAAQIWWEGGVRAMYRGFWPSLLSLCPFIGINFMVFDTPQRPSVLWFILLYYYYCSSATLRQQRFKEPSADPRDSCDGSSGGFDRTDGLLPVEYGQTQVAAPTIRGRFQDHGEHDDGHMAKGRGSRVLFWGHRERYQNCTR